MWKFLNKIKSASDNLENSEEESDKDSVEEAGDDNNEDTSTKSIDVTMFLSIPVKVKYMHWKTDFFSKHISLDREYERLLDALDRFVECCVMDTDRKYITANSISVDSDITSEDVVPILKAILEKCSSDMKKFYSGTDDLKSQADEITLTLKNIIYLASLKP